MFSFVLCKRGIIIYNKYVLFIKYIIMYDKAVKRVELRVLHRARHIGRDNMLLLLLLLLLLLSSCKCQWVFGLREL